MRLANNKATGKLSPAFRKMGNKTKNSNDGKIPQKMPLDKSIIFCESFVSE